MPEGPEIRIMTDWLRRRVLHKKLIGGRVLSGKYLKKGFRWHTGLVSEVKCHGKFSWMKVGDRWLTIGMGMTGYWSASKTEHSRLVFRFGDSNVFLNDSRNFANVKFMTTDEFDRKLNGLGPDILNATLAEFRESLQKTNASRRLPIAAALLNQKIVAGAGTYVVSEALYAAKVSPMRRVRTLDTAEVAAVYRGLVGVARRALNANSTGDVRRGNKMRFKIYGKLEDPKGRPVRKYEAVPGRNIAWCPLVQS